MKKRLFLSIPLSPYYIDAFVDFQEAPLDIEHIRWTKQENLHLTLSFFGDIEEHEIPNMIQRFRDIFSKISSFQLQFDTIIYAPPRRTRSTMLWGVFRQNEEYSALAQSIAQEFALDSKKEYIPHTTLARFKRPVLHDIFPLQVPPLSEPLFVQSCQLMESQLSETGSTYTQIEHFLI